MARRRLRESIDAPAVFPEAPHRSPDSHRTCSLSRQVEDVWDFLRGLLRMVRLQTVRAVQEFWGLIFTFDIRPAGTRVQERPGFQTERLGR